MKGPPFTYISLLLVDYLRAFGQRFSIFVDEADSVKIYSALLIHSDEDGFLSFDHSFVGK